MELFLIFFVFYTPLSFSLLRLKYTQNLNTSPTCITTILIEATSISSVDDY